MSSKVADYIISRIQLNTLGYDSNGKYYGRGTPLFQAKHKISGATVTFRSADYRKAATVLEGLLNEYAKSLN